MSMSISGGNNNAIPERPPLRHSDKIISDVKTDVASFSSAERVPTKINNIEELKKAELHGEHFSVSEEEVVRAIEKAIKAMQGKSTSLEFSVHEETKRIAVKVLDRETGDVIREVPPEKSLDFISKLWELAGLFVDERR